MTGSPAARHEERPDPRSVVVAGGGILGCLSALLLVEAGCTVTLVEREPELWRGASTAGEGKIHLGLVYAAGSLSTRTSMLDGALSFAALVERCVARRLDWTALAGDAFDYLVMPGSLRSEDQLAAVYAELDAEHAARGRPDYLGLAVDRLAARRAHVDADTRLPAFATAERAVDPDRLREIVMGAMDERAQHLTVLTSHEVTTMEQREGAVRVRHRDRRDPTTSTESSLVAAAVIDARWAWQGHGVQGARVGPRNLRVKSSLVLPVDASARTVTMVLGPYGDVVSRADSVYASWYPAARRAHEYSAFPSAALQHALAQATSPDPAVSGVDEQLAALRDLGLLARDRPHVGLRAGIIVGDGSVDIDSPQSALHDRADSGVARAGRVIMPRSAKFTTAPAAALDAVTAVELLLDEPSLPRGGR